MIAQLTAYGLSLDSLRLVHDYLLHVKLKTKISLSYIDWLEIRNFFRVNNECEEPLGIKYDCKLTFDEHVSDVSKKPGLQLNDLTRISPLMNISKRHTLMNAFSRSNFFFFLVLAQRPPQWRKCRGVIFQEKKNTFLLKVKN